MLQRLKSLFAEEDLEPDGTSFSQVDVAAAALLVRAARMDDDFGADERAIIAKACREHLGLSAEETDELIELASDEEKAATDLHRWTQTVKQNWDEAQKLALIESLWSVVYADGELHDYEANLLRRVAGLIYVPDREVGEARKRVLARLEKG